MLPFLKPKAIGLAIDVKKAESEGDNDSSKDIDPGLMAAADSLLDAIQSNDSKAVALALKDAFIICDSMPHDESVTPEDEPAA